MLSRFENKTPSELGCLRSIDAAWRFLVEEIKIPPKNIIIYGRSIGSGPSVDLVSRVDAGGVLLQSPLESGARAVLGAFVSMIGYHWDIFRNYEKIGKIRAPVGIMHGTVDKVIPVQNGKNLHLLLQKPF